MIEENIEKAIQTADLLLQDLREINRTGSPLLSLMILQKIEEVAKLQQTLSAIGCAIGMENDDPASTTAPAFTLR